MGGIKRIGGQSLLGWEKAWDFRGFVDMKIGVTLLNQKTNKLPIKIISFFSSVAAHPSS